MLIKNYNPIIEAFENAGIFLDKAQEILMYRVECQCIEDPGIKGWMIANMYLSCEIIDDKGEYIAGRLYLGERNGLVMSESKLRDFEDRELLKLPRILNLSDDELLNLSPRSNVKVCVTTEESTNENDEFAPKSKVKKINR